MSAAEINEGSQAALWNGTAGQAWVATQDLIDHMFRPFERLLVEGAAGRAQRVLDIGCGTGGTTIAIARALDADGHCVGIDISEPMIAAARAHAKRECIAADFIQADAQDYAFEPSGFDLIVSRFGVMFFSDPVAAFMNLRRAARPGSELKVIGWQSVEENPFMTTAERAAAPILPRMPARDLNGPGQFAFADQLRVSAILERGGWREASIEPLNMACEFPVADLERFFTQLGPLARALLELDEPTRTQVVSAVRAAFEPYVKGDAVRFNAACWLVEARA